MTKKGLYSWHSWQERYTSLLLSHIEWVLKSLIQLSLQLVCNRGEAPGWAREFWEATIDQCRLPKVVHVLPPTV